MARQDRPRLALAAAGALAAIAAAPASGAGPPAAELRVCVYYDAGPDAAYRNGELHAIMLENLLGHFREVRPAVSKAERYEKGGLASCDRAAYIGSFFGARLPKPFLEDAASYRKPFLWLNYNLQALRETMGPEAFEKKTGFSFVGMRGYDEPRPASGVPGFFRDFEYKGERFTKVVAAGADGALVAAPEIAIVSTTSARVLSTAVHSRGGEKTPYALEKDGFFYVGDNPFVYIGEADRYLIVADLLFDFLALPPRDERRRALVRLEDVHPSFDLRILRQAVAELRRLDVPFAISLIPKFVPAGGREEQGVELASRPEFLAELKASGAALLLHGYTHATPARDGCPALASGADYEFWDRCRGAPLSGTAAHRVSRAKALVEEAGLDALGWVTPHYMASPEDFRVFGAEFDRTVQRVRYEAGGAFVSQFFPYTIYRDHYGQFVWPENLGFVPMPGADPAGLRPEEMVLAARRSRVVRDAWASFFWHPQLVAVPGEAGRLASLIKGIREAGYEFESLDLLKKTGL